MVQVECFRQKVAQSPLRLLSIPGITRNKKVRSKFAHCLPTRPAGWRRLIRFTCNCNFLERRQSLRDSSGNGHSLGAERLSVSRVLDVAPGDDFTCRSEHRGSHAKARIRCIRILHCGEGGVSKASALVRRVAHLAVISPRNDRPAPRYETPSHSPIVAPRSENVGRTPRSTGATRRPRARSGTRSRAWSVEGVVGSLP